jgi:hypothetical protein
MTTILVLNCIYQIFIFFHISKGHISLFILSRTYVLRSRDPLSVCCVRRLLDAPQLDWKQWETALFVDATLETIRLGQINLEMSEMSHHRLWRMWTAREWGAGSVFIWLSNGSAGKCIVKWYASVCRLNGRSEWLPTGVRIPEEQYHDVEANIYIQKSRTVICEPAESNPGNNQL